MRRYFAYIYIYTNLERKVLLIMQYLSRRQKWFSNIITYEQHEK